ncbi:hypothetical protein [Agrococcus baldri]|nr:hypothetical protein [Agrococcus baldri]
MLEAATCTVDAFIIRGERFDRLRQAGARAGRDGRCGDCGVQRQGFHHYGCDMEACPRCGRQLLSCGCGDDPDDDEVVDIMAVAGGVVVHPAALRGLHVAAGRFPFKDADGLTRHRP